MLIGEYNHNIDTKGRLIIPSKFREELGDNFIITKGFDNCLFVFPEKEWKAFGDKLAALPMSQKNARAMTRFFFGSAVEGDLDKQGRVLLSSALRSHAGLEKEVVLVGTRNRVEIWDKARWDADNAENCENMEEITENLNELGFNF